MQKRSITIKGHRTSIALEPPFWRALELIAQRRALSLPQLVAQVDERRVMMTPGVNLASALRVFALHDAQGHADEDATNAPSGPSSLLRDQAD